MKSWRFRIDLMADSMYWTVRELLDRNYRRCHHRSHRLGRQWCLMVQHWKGDCSYHTELCQFGGGRKCPDWEPTSDVTLVPGEYFDRLAASLDDPDPLSPALQEAATRAKRFRRGSKEEDQMTDRRLSQDEIDEINQAFKRQAAIDTECPCRDCEDIRREEEEDQMTDRRLTKTYYRSLTPDGRVWCESRDPQEVREQRHPDEVLTFKRMDVYEVTDGWQEWEGQ